jgi:hypothetical protein
MENGRRDTEGWQQEGVCAAQRTAGLVDQRRLGVSWWLLALAVWLLGLWFGPRKRRVSPSLPFGTAQMQSARVENGHGPADLGGVTDLSLIARLPELGGGDQS